MADALIERLVKLQADLVDAKKKDKPNTRWIQLLEKNIKRTKAEIKASH